jgi:hypothetical protein
MNSELFIIEGGTFSECSFPIDCGYGGTGYLYFNNDKSYTFALNRTIDFDFNNAKRGQDIYTMQKYIFVFV